MVTLKTNFADGDVLYAGTATSTSNVNGITATVNNKIGSVSSSLSRFSSGFGGTGSTTETIIISHTIAAGTYLTGCLVMCPVYYYDHTAGTSTTLKLKIGAVGSEATVMTEVTGAPAANIDQHVPLIWHDRAANYANAVNVCVTADNIVTTSGIVYPRQLIVSGF
jgi:hypothetical protein